MAISGKREKLILTTEISDRIIDASTIMDEKAKKYYTELSGYIKGLLQSETKLDSYGITTLKNTLLTQWNESINPDTEKFWAELKANNIDYERKDTLKFALQKRRFRNVEQGMEARKHWTALKKLTVIQESFTEADRVEIDKIIAEDEAKRLKILKKCLSKYKIPQTQYLKFGECMAYFHNCRLFDKYFTVGEVETLFAIWRSFTAK